MEMPSVPFKPQTADYRNGAKPVAYYEDEMFKPYPGDNRFLVSDRGSVYDTYDKVLLVPRTAKWSGDPNRTLNPYHHYHLIGHYGNAPIHRLVLETFNPNPHSSFLDVNHIDGCKWNNRWSSDPSLNNLEWNTRSQNVQHAYDTGLVDHTQRNCTRYTAEQIHDICRLLEQGYSTKQAADELGYSGFSFYRLVSNLRNGKVWNRVTSNYSIPPANRHSKEEVMLICQLLMQRLTDPEVSERMKNEFGYDVKPGFIKSIRYRNETWYDIVKDYDFPRPGKYSEEQIEGICKAIEEGKKSSQIARDLGIEFSDSFKSIVSQIRTGKVYQDIASRYKIHQMNNSPMDQEKVDKIRRLSSEGFNSRQIAEDLGIPYSNTFSSIVSQISKGITYASSNDGMPKGRISVTLKPR